MREKITFTIIWHDHRKPLILTLHKKLLKRALYFLSVLFVVFLLFQIQGIEIYLNKRDFMLLTQQVKEREKLLHQELEQLSSLKVHLQNLEDRISHLENFLHEKGIRLKPKGGVGGRGGGQVSLNKAYLEFLQNRTQELYELLEGIPLGFPLSGNLTSSFGWRKNPFGRGYEFHTGIDLEAPEGTPIIATAKGVVVFAGKYYEYGNTIIIKHPNDYYTLYGHLSKFAVKEGEEVKSGQIIGYVGNSGRSTGPHLHYEIIRKNKSLNPTPFLR